MKKLINRIIGEVSLFGIVLFPVALIFIPAFVMACEVKTPEEHATERREHYENDLSTRLIHYSPEEGVDCYFLPPRTGNTDGALTCFPKPKLMLLPGTRTLEVKP